MGTFCAVIFRNLPLDECFRCHVRFGSFATKPFSASAGQCQVCAVSDQNVAAPRLSAKCQKQI